MDWLLTVPLLLIKILPVMQGLSGRLFTEAELARRAIPLFRTRICSLIGAVTMFVSMLIGLETEFSRSA